MNPLGPAPRPQGPLAGLRPETAAALLERVPAGGEMTEVWQVPAPSRQSRLHLSPSGDLVETDLGSHMRLISADGRVRGDLDLGAGVSSPTPAFRADGSFVVVRGGALRSYAANGQEQWDAKIEFSLKAAATVGPEGNAYVFGEDRLHALDAQGQKLWSVPAVGPGMNARPVVLGEGTVCAELQDGAVAAWSPTGEELWRVPTAGVRADLAAGLDGTVVFAGDDGRLHCLSGADGRTLWSRPLEGEAGTPEVDGLGNIYVRGASAEAVCFGPDGGERWRSAGGPVEYVKASPFGGAAVLERGHGLHVLSADGVPVASYEEDAWLSRPQFGPDGVLYTSGEKVDRAVMPLERLLQQLAAPEEPPGAIAREGEVVHIGGIDLPVRG